jgi:hypothetical protein
MYGSYGNIVVISQNVALVYNKKAYQDTEILISGCQVGLSME